MYKLHAKIGDFEFVEAEVATIEELKDQYQKILAEFGLKCPVVDSKGGLPPVEWNKALDTYLEQNTLHSETYANMNEWQKTIIQEIKRSIARLKYRNQK